ncbi:hypothetical protein OS493_001148 [Desmophyllum pertusum]|uniref:Uncharacterized protein n=1 Tax=Desmophyllum pertusum TaxID=174260 RepID=A0A9W9ZXG5_9CNID|nr:hypothetical protein OS493_001148 [Desmophyllum pertusum]
MRGILRVNASHKSENDTKSWLIFYWSTFFGTGLKLHEKCEKGDCPVAGELTIDQSRGKEADGFVIHVNDPTGGPPVESVPWILQTRENPIYTPKIIHEILQRFEKEQTTSDDSWENDIDLTVAEMQCQKQSASASIKSVGCGSNFQVLTFPPILKKVEDGKSRSGISINVIVLDSISRPHLYRTLPRAVEAFRKINQDPNIKATAMDFELFQSIGQQTFENLRPFLSGVLKGELSLLWWKEFQEKVAKKNIDHFGLMHFSCTVVNKYGRTNYYDYPEKVCFNGQFFTRYFIDYITKVYTALKIDEKAKPLLSYLHLNTGHETNGKQIINIDAKLANFFIDMVAFPDTVTFIFSHHGDRS